MSWKIDLVDIYKKFDWAERHTNGIQIITVGKIKECHKMDFKEHIYCVIVAIHPFKFEDYVSSEKYNTNEKKNMVITNDLHEALELAEDIKTKLPSNPFS